MYALHRHPLDVSFVYHDEIYSDFFLFRAQKRGMLKKVRFLPQEAIPKAKGL